MTCDPLKGGALRFWGGWLFLVASALVAGACDGDGTAETTLAPAATTTVAPTSTTTSSPTTPSTTSTTTTTATTTAAVSSPTWSRVPHDKAVFGGEGYQVMNSVTVGGPGLVAVGWDGPYFDAVAAVWTSPDGITWSRVPTTRRSSVEPATR